MEIEKLLEEFVFPVRELTKNSKHKVVRAAGMIVTNTILLPWQILVLMIIAFVFLPIACLVDWWEDV